MRENILSEIFRFDSSAALSTLILLDFSLNFVAALIRTKRVQ